MDLTEKIEAADRGEKPAPAPEPLVVGVAVERPEDLAAAIEAALWVGGVVQWGDVIKSLLPDKCAVRVDDARLAKIGAALAKVAAHYKWKWGAWFSHPVGGLIAECFPVAEPVLRPMIENVIARITPAAAPAPANDASVTPAAAEVRH